MNDREMLELAAKAASMQVLGWSNACQALLITGPKVWDPLHDDGDAFRLAVTLKIEILFSGPGEPKPWVSAIVKNTMIHAAEDIVGNPVESVKRAITRAAAEIGKTK